MIQIVLEAALITVKFLYYVGHANSVTDVGRP